MTHEKIWLVGERASAVSFLSTLVDAETGTGFRSACKKALSDETERAYGISCVYSSTDHVEAKGREVVLYCSQIPVGTQIEWHESFDNCLCDFLLLLFSFKFEKNLEKKLKLLSDQLFVPQNKPLRIKAVLFDDPDIHTGATDLEHSGSELQIMRETLLPVLEKFKLDRIIETVMYRGDSRELFSGGDRTLCYFHDVIEKHISTVCDNFDWTKYNAEVVYEWKNDRDTLDLLTNYSQVQDSKDMLRTYTDAFLASEFWRNAMKVLYDEYKKCVQSVAFWDIGAEWERIEEQLGREASEFLNRSGRKISIKGKSDSEYSDLLSKKKYDLEFGSEITKLLAEVIPNSMKKVLRSTISIFSASV